MRSFKTDWARHHGDFVPLGYEMRNASAPNWIRFHSLPGSKRYANHPEEYAILLARQNQLALEVLGDQQCWLVQSQWPLPDPENHSDRFRATRERGLLFAFSFIIEPGTEFESQWNAYANLVTFTEGAFDDLLLDIADERAGPTIWMSATSGQVFAPYDGGIDLFLADATTSERLKDKYLGWRPQNGFGL